MKSRKSSNVPRDGNARTTTIMRVQLKKQNRNCCWCTRCVAGSGWTEGLRRVQDAYPPAAWTLDVCRRSIYAQSKQASEPLPKSSRLIQSQAGLEIFPRQRGFVPSLRLETCSQHPVSGHEANCFPLVRRVPAYSTRLPHPNYTRWSDETGQNRAWSRAGVINHRRPQL